MEIKWQNFFGGGMGRNSVRYYKAEINGKRVEKRENYAGKKYSIGNIDEAKKKYNSEQDFITYKCKENDAVLQVHFDYPPDSIHKTQIGEIHLQDPVKGGWFVIGYQDLKDAIREAEQARGAKARVVDLTANPKTKEITEEVIKEMQELYFKNFDSIQKEMIASFIPQQLCPVCNGESKIPSSGTSTFQVCPKCNGERTIPMLKA